MRKAPRVGPVCTVRMVSLLGALAMAGQAVASTPNSVESLAERARAAEDELEYEEASSLWLRSLLLDNVSEAQQLEAYLNAGRISFLLGREDEASSHFLYVLRRDLDHQLSPDAPPRIQSYFEVLREQARAELAPEQAEPPTEAPQQDTLDPAPPPATPVVSGADPGEAGDFPLLVAGGGAAAGFGAVALVFGGVMGLLSLQAHEAAEAGVVQLERETHYGERDVLALIANVGYASGVVLLAAGAGLAGASLMMETE